MCTGPIIIAVGEGGRPGPFCEIFNAIPPTMIIICVHVHYKRGLKKKGEHTPTFDRVTQFFVRTILQRMVKNVCFPGKGYQSLIYKFNVMRIRKMLISYIKLDHA